MIKKLSLSYSVSRRKQREQSKGAINEKKAKENKTKNEVV